MIILTASAMLVALEMNIKYNTIYVIYVGIYAQKGSRSQRNEQTRLIKYTQNCFAIRSRDETNDRVRSYNTDVNTHTHIQTHVICNPQTMSIMVVVFLCVC